MRIGDTVTVHYCGYDPTKVYMVTDILYYPENERYAFDFPDLELNDGEDYVSSELCHKYSNWVFRRARLKLTNFSKTHPCPKTNDMYIKMFPWWYPKHSFMVGA